MVFIFLLAHSLNGSAEPTCGVKWGGASQAELNLNGRHVTVLGWTHLDGAGESGVGRAIVQAVMSAQAKNCVGAASVLREHVTKMIGPLREAERVEGALGEAHRRHALKTISTEYTPEEEDEDRDRQVGNARALDLVHELCGKKVEPQLSQVRLLWRGPSNAFADRHAGVLTLASERQDAKDQNVRDFFAEKTTVNFGIGGGAQLERHPEWRPVRKSILAGTVPREADLDAVVAKMSGDPAANREVVRKDVKTWMKRMSGVALRNAAIAKNTLGQDGNAAVVVGGFHAENLVDQFVHACRAHTPTDRLLPSGAPPEGSGSSTGAGR